MNKDDISIIKSKVKLDLISGKDIIEKSLDDIKYVYILNKHISKYTIYQKKKDWILYSVKKW